MKGENPDKLEEVTRLVKKLGELAEVLDEVSTKMRLAVEKQRIGLEHLGRPNREGRRVLDDLHKKLESIESVPLANIQLATAKQVSQELIDSNPNDHTPLSRMAYHQYVEFTCIDEFKKFRDLPAISPEEIQLCDFEMLCDQFADED